MLITMIGHSTVLLEVAGLRILTDPYFGGWGNPAYARLRPPARTREDLQDVDLVLVSHNHWDHTDRAYFRSLAGDVPVLAPARSGWLTKLQGARTVVGLKTWQSHECGEVTVTAVPAIHLAVTCGFVVQAEGKQVYFAGDTFYRPFMQEISRRFQLAAALMPVTTYRLPMTMGEKGAVRAVTDLKPRVVIPIHLGLQPRSPLLRTSHSLAGFECRLREARLATEIILLHEGESWTVS